MTSPLSPSALLDAYESNMTKWMREPEQYRQMIVKETNKMVKLARWSCEAKKALEEIGKKINDCGSFVDGHNEQSDIAQKALSSFPQL